MTGRDEASVGAGGGSALREATRVLFIHPSYPSQFTAIAEELNRRDGYRCDGLIYEAMRPAVPAEATTRYHGFFPDGQVSDQTYPFSSALEVGMRNTRGIANALLMRYKEMHYDVVIGHASFGSTLFLRSLLPSAIIAYSELPGYQAAAARPCFPLTADQALMGQSLEALHYLAMLQADLCIVPSEYARRLYPEELQPKIRVQMEGFDTTDLPPGSRAEREALGLSPDRPLVGFFSRTLEAVRGFDIFLRVAQRLNELSPGMEFLVIGDEQTLYGNETAYLNGQSFKEFALAQTNVPPQLFRWYPMIPYEHFRRLIACLDVAILPLFEGAGNWSLFEAMALGLPILTSNRCYISEAIRNGLDGMLLDPYDVEGFAQSTLALLREPRRARLLGESAKKRVRRKFSIPRAADGYARIIEEALRLQRARPLPQPLVG